MRHRVPLSLLALMLFVLSLPFILQSLAAQPPVPIPASRDTVQLLQNADFETDADLNKIPDGWTGNNTAAAKSDKLKCDQPDSPVAYSGTCAFMFRGNPAGSSSALSQTLSDFTALTEGSTLQFDAYLDPRSGTPGAAFGKVQVTLSTGAKINLKLTIPSARRAVADYVLVSDSADLVLNGASITKVKAKFYTHQTKGKFLVDAVSLTVFDNTATATATAPVTETATATPTLTDVPTATATATIAPAQLLSDDGSANNNFGASVAISGDTAVVGAPFKDGMGAAYVFIRTGDVWSQQQKLTADDAASGDYFGGSVAIAGDMIIVGAPDKASSTGAAYVFTRSGGVWSQQDQLTASDTTTGDHFGSAAAISGDTLLIGAWGRSSFQGIAYIFTYNGSSWSEQDTLTASDGTGGDQFGAFLALDGDTALVTAFAKNTHRGAAYVFTRSGTDWSEQQKLTASDAASNDFFGISAALAGDTALIGAKYAGDGGVVYVFTRSGSLWTEQPSFSGSDATGASSFGSSAAISTSGTLVVIGAENQSASMGAAYVFTGSGGTWSEQEKLTAPDAAETDYLGRAIALDANTAVVGSPEDAVSGSNNQGSAWVFIIR